MLFKNSLLFLLIFSASGTLYAADQRTRALDIYVIIDDATMSGGSRTEVLDWLCGTLIDRILQAGDHLVICVAQERPQVLFDKLILGEDQKNEAKNLVQNIQYAGKTVNYAASLREAARRSIDSRTISYTLLIGGTEMRVSPASTEANVAELLKYSKTDAFSGWKLITVGLGIDSRAGRAAASYMNRFN